MSSFDKCVLCRRAKVRRLFRRIYGGDVLIVTGVECIWNFYILRSISGILVKMQITIKTLQQQTFKVSVEPTELVSVFVLNQHLSETWIASVKKFQCC